MTHQKTALLFAKCAESTEEQRHWKQILEFGNYSAISGREWQTKIKGGLFWRRHESPRGFAPTPAPPAQNEKSSTLLNQHDQIEGVSYSALPENPLRAADRVSSLIKSCLTKTSHQIPVCFNLERIKKLPRLVSILCVCVWICEQREAFIIWGRDICLNILLLLCDQRFSAEFFWNLLSVKDL